MEARHGCALVTSPCASGPSAKFEETQETEDQAFLPPGDDTPIGIPRTQVDGVRQAAFRERGGGLVAWPSRSGECAMAAINGFWTLTRCHGRAAKRAHSSLGRAVRAFIQGRGELEGVSRPCSANGDIL